MQKLIRLPQRSPLASQMLVIGALLHRELAMRSGRFNFGLVWMLIEPLLGVLIIGVLLGFLASRSVPQIPYPFFVLQGMLQLQLFKGCVSSGTNAMNKASGLLSYPNVKPLDIFLARFIFEFLEALVSCVVFCVVSAWMGVEFSLGSLDKLLFCYLITALCGSGFGLICGIVAQFFADIQKIVMVILRPLLFLSCVLHPLHALPRSLQSVLLYNPLVHCIELSRQALFPFYTTGDCNFYYPAVFGLVVMSSGLCFYRLKRHAMNAE